MSTLGRGAARAPINTADIPDGIITSAKVAADVLTAADIAPNAVTASELADDAVDGTKIADNAIDSEHVAADSLDAEHYAAGSVDATAIADDAVTMAKLSATGTASADTFLRGDNSWAAAGSPSITDNGDANAMTIGSDESVTFVGATAIPSIKETDKHNLTGTYSDHEMIMGRTFTLTGDINVNENLVLANLSGSGNDIILQDDGTARTITTAGKVFSCTTINTDATVTTASTATLHPGTGVSGTGIAAGATIASITNATTFELSAVATASGTVNLTFATGVLEAGELMSNTIRQDLTGMTGTLGSGLTFPAGHVLQVQHGYLTTNFTTTTSGVWMDTGLTVTITPSSTSSKIFIEASVTGVGNSQSGYNTKVSILQPIANSDANVVLSDSRNYYRDYNAQGTTLSGGNVTYRAYSWGGLDSPASTSALTYGVCIKGEGTGTSRTLYFNNSHSSTTCYNAITAWEIAG